MEVLASRHTRSIAIQLKKSRGIGQNHFSGNATYGELARRSQGRSPRSVDLNMLG